MYTQSCPTGKSSSGLSVDLCEGIRELLVCRQGSSIWCNHSLCKCTIHTLEQCHWLARSYSCCAWSRIPKCTLRKTVVLKWQQLLDGVHSRRFIHQTLTGVHIWFPITEVHKFRRSAANTNYDEWHFRYISSRAILGEDAIHGQN